MAPARSTWKGKMYQRSVTEQQFRRHVAKVRGQFVDLFARDPEQALVDLLEELSDLIRDAARLDATFGFGVTDQPITTSRVRAVKSVRHGLSKAR